MTAGLRLQYHKEANMSVPVKENGYKRHMIGCMHTLTYVNCVHEPEILIRTGRKASSFYQASSVAGLTQ